VFQAPFLVPLSWPTLTDVVRSSGTATVAFANIFSEIHLDSEYPLPIAELGLSSGSSFAGAVNLAPNEVVLSEERSDVRWMRTAKYRNTAGKYD
jgi:hypothetical protein